MALARAAAAQTFLDKLAGAASEETYRSAELRYCPQMLPSKWNKTSQIRHDERSLSQHVPVPVFHVTMLQRSVPVAFQHSSHEIVARNWPRHRHCGSPASTGLRTYAENALALFAKYCYLP